MTFPFMTFKNFIPVYYRRLINNLEVECWLASNKSVPYVFVHSLLQKHENSYGISSWINFTLLCSKGWYSSPWKFAIRAKWTRIPSGRNSYNISLLHVKKKWRNLSVLDFLMLNCGNSGDARSKYIHLGRERSL